MLLTQKHIITQKKKVLLIDEYAAQYDMDKNKVSVNATNDSALIKASFYITNTKKKHIITQFS